MQNAVVTITRNDESIIAEWMAYHRAIGFDRIHVFDNESTDATARIVTDAAKNVDGITLESWPSGDHDILDRQRFAYNRALDIMRAEGVEWCLFIDTDEFMACTEDEKIPAFLDRRCGNAAIALHWCFYGSSGHLVDPPGLLIENFRYRAPANFAPQALCKSLVRIPYTQYCINPHTFYLDAAHFPYLDCSGQWVVWESSGQDHVISPWRINHYLVRSRARWAQKVARSQAAGFARQLSEWDTYDRNEYLDTSALKHASAVRKEIERMGLPVPPTPALEWV